MKQLMTMSCIFLDTPLLGEIELGMVVALLFIYVNIIIPFSILLKHPSIELLLVNIKLKHQNVTCGVYYKPPSAHQSDLGHLETAIEELLPSCSKSLLLMGDFNIDLINGNHHQLDSIQDKFGLKQVITVPTRSTSNTSSLIDHVYLSDQLSCQSFTIQPPLHGSDHNTILLSLNKPLPPPKKVHCRKIWLYKQADFETANSSLSRFPNVFLPVNDVDFHWCQWYNFFMTTISQNIPTKVIKLKQKNLPYLTQNLMMVIRKKI